MEDIKKIEGNLPDLIEPRENQAVEKNEPVKIDGSLQSKKIWKDNKIEQPKSTDSLQDLLLKNIKLSETIFKQNRKIKRRLNIMLLGNYLKLILILTPLIFAFIYLFPLIGQLFSQYSNLLGGTDSAAGLGDILAPGKFDISGILNKNISAEDLAKLQEMIKNNLK